MSELEATRIFAMCCSQEHQAAKINCHNATAIPEMDNEGDTSGEESEEKKWVEKCQFLNLWDSGLPSTSLQADFLLILYLFLD